MASPKENKGKKKNKTSEANDGSVEQLKSTSAKGDEKGAKKKSKDVEKNPGENAKGVASNEGTLSSLPMESKGTETLEEDSPKTEKEVTKEEDGIRRPLKWHPDEIHCRQLCQNCLKINYYWPPRLRPPTPADKDPNLIYPGDLDPDFKPSRGDILIVHPKGLGLDPKPSPEDLWWKSKRIGGGFCICYDGDNKFEFQEGDLVLRIGSYLEGEAELEHQDMAEEGGESKHKKGTKPPKPPKIADPPQLDPVTYKPYDKVELYICTGFEILKEEEPLDLDALELELKRVVEANTNYNFSMQKSTVGPFQNTTSRKKSLKDGNLVSNNLKRRTSLEKDANNSEVKPLEHVGEIENNSISKAENLARKFVESRDLAIITHLGQTCLETQDLDANMKAPKDEKQPKVKLIWIFLGSQSELQVGDNITPIRDPRCPGLGCFYNPYLNLGNHCNKQDHGHRAPNLGDILITDKAWAKKFDHRKNEWQSLVEWFIPLYPPLQSPLESMPIDDLAQEGEPLIADIDNGKEKKSKEKGQKPKDKEEDGAGKVGKGKGSTQEEKKKSLDSSSKDQGLLKSNSIIRKQSKGGKGKETAAVVVDELPLEKADKAIQVPEDLEEKKDENLDSQDMPNNLRKELTLGTILLRPLVGRQFNDQKTRVEEWKWPRKYKIWGSVEMYMVEQGTENLKWVFWGRSERICDTPQPVPQFGTKLKFLHPKDAKVEIPGMEEGIQEEPPLVIEGDKTKPPKVDTSNEEAKPDKEVGNKKKKTKREGKL